jgi:hypothetical protein
MEMQKNALSGKFEIPRQYAPRSGAVYCVHIQSIAWKQLRDTTLRRDKYRCQDCLNQIHLQVHHRTYARLGAERIDDLETLCETCHRKRHHAAWTNHNEAQLCLASVRDEVCQVCWREWARHVLWNVSLCEVCHRDYVALIEVDELGAYGKLRLSVQPFPESVRYYADEIADNELPALATADLA